MNYQVGPDYRNEDFVLRGYPELAVDVGEVVRNFAATGGKTAPDRLLVPG